METQAGKEYIALDFGEILECSLRYWIRGLPRYIPMYLALNLVAVAAAYGLIFLSGVNPWVAHAASLIFPGIPQSIFLPLPPIDLSSIMFLVVLGVVFLAYILLGVFVSATVTKYVAEWHAGMEPDLKGCFSHAWKRKLPIIGSFLLVTVITSAIGAGGIFILVALMLYLLTLLLWSPFTPLSPILILIEILAIFAGIILLLILLIYISVRLSVYLPAVVLDDAGAVESLTTSWRLVKGNFWRTFAVMLIIGLISMAITMPVSVLSMWFIFIPPLPQFLLIFSVIYVIIVSITSPLMVAAQTMIYHDLMGRYRGAYGA